MALCKCSPPHPPTPRPALPAASVSLGSLASARRSGRAGGRALVGGSTAPPSYNCLASARGRHGTFDDFVANPTKSSSHPPSIHRASLSLCAPARITTKPEVNRLLIAPKLRAYARFPTRTRRAPQQMQQYHGMLARGRRMQHPAAPAAAAGTRASAPRPVVAPRAAARDPQPTAPPPQQQTQQQQGRYYGRRPPGQGLVPLKYV